MCSIIPKDVYDKLMANAPKPSPGQGNIEIAVNRENHPSAERIREVIERAIRNAPDRAILRKKP
jgi:hypothetical protein